MPFENTTQSPKLLRNIYEVTLDKFIDCICDQRYEVLVLPGHKVPAEEIFRAWHEIYEQYLDCIRDDEQQYILKLSREINILSTKLNLINLIVERLSIQHNAEVLEQLKKLLNVPGKFDSADREAYHKDLEMVLTLSRRMYVELKEKEYEYEKLVPTVIGNIKIQRSHFDTLIVQLSKYMKFQINRREIYVSEFMAMIEDLRTTMKIHKSQSIKK